MTQGYEMVAPRHILKVRYQTFRWQLWVMCDQEYWDALTGTSYQ